jgi:hypothetical protein
MLALNISAKLNLKKTDIALNLACRFNTWALKKDIAPCICLIDGFYTNRKIIEYIVKAKGFKGFIGRFNKGRNITTSNYFGLLKTYISGLVLSKDFSAYQVNDQEKLIHETNIRLDYGPALKLIVILDDPNDINSARPLITNLIHLSAEKIAEYYAIRWKEETYHQVIKDAFFARTHKFRKIKTLSRYLELINIAYGLCEQRRWSKYNGQKTVFAIKNELLILAKENFILNLKGRKMSKARQKDFLQKFKV